MSCPRYVPWCAGLLSSLALTAFAFADGDAVAIVNGNPISAQRLGDVLKDAYGLQVLQQLIVLELAKAETRQRGLTVTDAEVQVEFDRALDGIAPKVNEQGQKLTDAERRQSLDFMLRQKNLSLPEFKLGMERNAHLRKLIEGAFKVDDATLREEFARTHGERVEVRHIQIDASNVAALHEALSLLEKGTDFAEVARRVSQNQQSAAQGGLLPPFTFHASDDEVAPALREVAFSLKPGEVSKPIRVARWWQILKLERRIPPADVRFEDLRDEVERSLRERVTTERMNELVTRLYKQAEVRVLDRQLREEYEKLLAQNQAAAPGTAP